MTSRFCLNCNYDLRQSAGRCPECGAPFDPSIPHSIGRIRRQHLLFRITIGATAAWYLCLATVTWFEDLATKHTITAAFLFAAISLVILATHRPGCLPVFSWNVVFFAQSLAIAGMWGWMSAESVLSSTAPVLFFTAPALIVVFLMFMLDAALPLGTVLRLRATWLLVLMMIMVVAVHWLVRPLDEARYDFDLARKYGRFFDEPPSHFRIRAVASAAMAVAFGVYGMYLLNAVVPTRDAARNRSR